ncbi:MAG: hypothetical protein NTZ24_15215 [Deltaproteobacteria bacterium]|nr:hypothetical protein [Deltaproteobacteria bacterium]
MRGLQPDNERLAYDEIEAWQRELKVADTEGRFTFAGMMFAVKGRK